MSKECVTSCPLLIICAEGQASVDGLRKHFFGYENNSGLISQLMDAAGEIEQASDSVNRVTGPVLDMQKKLLLEVGKTIDAFEPLRFDQSTLIDACPNRGPTENREDLQYGFNVVSRCDSTAISEETRTAFQLITQKSDNSAD